MTKIDAFIVDIDGTVALHGDERGHFEYSKVSGDQPNKPIIEIVQRLWQSSDSEIWPYPDIQPVFMSGRADEGNVRRDSMSWLHEHVGMHTGYFTQKYGRLFMRPEFLPDGKRDFRPDDVVKEELYRTLVEPHFNIHFAIDDRPRVLRMWQRIGIPTLAVGSPWIEF